MMTDNSPYAQWKWVKEVVYKQHGFELVNEDYLLESADYGTGSCAINGKKIQFRVSKITPTKAGQFVAIWKRSKEGTTMPFDFSDMDFIIILSKSDDKIGQFIFPKTVLADNGIITRNGKEGKRGIRVYPPWDGVQNKQAKKTQHWQAKYFVEIKSDNTTDVELVKRLFSQVD